MKATSLLFLLLTSCATAPVTPHDCRQVGVNVPDGAEVTGRIVGQNIADAATVKARCQCPFRVKHGCTLAVNEGEYVIWAVDDARVLAEEQCHALFEVGH